jgi:hypothetical protein
MLSEQNHRLAAKMLEQQGELNRARTRVAELEAGKARGVISQALKIADLQAQLERANADVERLRRPHTDTMASVDASCRAALGDRLDTDVLVDAMADFVRSHVNATAYYREQLDRATEARADEMTREEQCAHDMQEHGDKPCRQCSTW